MADSKSLEQLKILAGVPVEDQSTDSLIGILQVFRPNGLPVSSVFTSEEGGVEFERRLNLLYAATRESRRYDSMRDAYFIVRNPPMLSASDAEKLAYSLIAGWREIAEDLEAVELSEMLTKPLKVRVLEGKPPKHPRATEEQAGLLLAIDKDLPLRIDQLFSVGGLGHQLSEALYFAACDALLRDYLRWPLLQRGDDPLAAYFELWRHAVKFRIFRNDTIDFYLPYRSSGEMI